jgi:hypothetical protein
LDRQYDDIRRQSGDIDNIDKYTARINEKKEELNRLELENQKVEILSLLREFGIIDTYDQMESNDVLDEDIDEDLNNSAVKDEIDAIINGVSQEEEESEFSFDIPSFGEEVANNEEEIDVSDIGITNEVVDFDNALDNQVVLVEDAVMIDLELIRSKASKVMNRVGEMLGIKTNDYEVKSVSNEVAEEVENPLFSNNVDTDVNDSENPLFSNNIETSETNSNDENPLFRGENIETTSNNNDLFSFPETNFDDNNDSGDFWFPSDMPDALNELPDLDSTSDSNNFFSGNIGELDFPDLNLDFDDMEGNL